MFSRDLLRAVRELSEETRIILTEIRKQKNAQEELKTAYRELDKFLQTVPDGLAVIKLDHTVVRINDNLANLTGLTRDEAEGSKCYDLFGCENCLTSNCPINKVLAEDDQVELEVEKQFRDGQTIACLITAAPLKDAEGETTSIIKIIKDITRRKKSTERINYLAFHDHLTGLPNKICFMDRLSLEIAHAKRNKKILGILYIDLDGFKNVNDELGHEIGDQVLSEAAKRLKLVARESDTVARLGGDEFAVLLSGLNQQKDVVIFAKRLVAAFREPCQLRGMPDQRISASVGIALYPGDSDNPYTLLKKADEAMYRAKKDERVFQFYNYYLNENQ